MNRKNKWTPLLFLAPFLLLFLLYRCWPILSAFLLSFQELKGIDTSRFVGVHNYADLFGDRQFTSSLKITTLFALGATLLLIPIPLLLATVLFGRSTPLPNLWRVLLFLPSLVSLVVVGTVFRIILADHAGLLNSAIGLLGVHPILWLLSVEWTVPSLILLALWRWTGMNIIYFTSRLDHNSCGYL